MTEGEKIAADMPADMRAELLRIAAQDDCAMPTNAIGRRLLAQGLLDGRRGKALSALGQSVAEALGDAR